MGGEDGYRATRPAGDATAAPVGRATHKRVSYAHNHRAFSHPDFTVGPGFSPDLLDRRRRYDVSSVELAGSAS